MRRIRKGGLKNLSWEGVCFRIYCRVCMCVILFACVRVCLCTFVQLAICEDARTGWVYEEEILSGLMLHSVWRAEFQERVAAWKLWDIYPKYLPHNQGQFCRTLVWVKFKFVLAPSLTWAVQSRFEEVNKSGIRNHCPCIKNARNYVFPSSLGQVHICGVEEESNNVSHAS